MARAKKSAPDAPAGDAPSQLPESAASSTPTKKLAKKGATAGRKRRAGSPGPGQEPDSRQEAAEPDQTTPGPTLVVGIGASAGGYEALTQFFPALPPTPAWPSW